MSKRMRSILCGLTLSVVVNGGTPGAELTTADGVRVIFDPERIAFIEMEPSLAGLPGQMPWRTGPPKPAVYGIMSTGPLWISQTIADFLEQLKLSEKFAQLTLSGGDSIWVKAEAVSYVRSKSALDHVAPEVHAFISIGGKERAIREDVESARKAIDDHRGKL